jgi:spore coat protein H
MFSHFHILNHIFTIKVHSMRNYHVLYRQRSCSICRYRPILFFLTERNWTIVLKTYKIFINPHDLKILRNDNWSEDHFDAKLVTEDNKKYNIQLGYRGHQIRKHKKKSYHIQFTNPWLKDKVHEIHLNAEYKDPSLIRNKLSMDFFNSIGVLAPRTEHILLYINGVYKGVYLQLESMDEYALKNRELPLGPIYYATNDDANFSLMTPEGEIKSSLLDGYTQKVGSVEDDSMIHDLLVCINTFPAELFNKQISKMIDINNYVKWLSGVVCTQNFDGFIHNYALYKNSKTRLIEMSPWDYDGTWGRDINGLPLAYDYVPIEGYNTLTSRLLQTTEYRSLYKSILANILKTTFTVENIQPRIEQNLSLIFPYILDDPVLKMKKDEFQIEGEVMVEFIRKRNQYLRDQLTLLD